MRAPQESNGSILSWARSAKPACELAPKAAPEGLALATFAGGCFWGLELAYQASARARERPLLALELRPSKAF